MDRILLVGFVNILISSVLARFSSFVARRFARLLAFLALGSSLISLSLSIYLCGFLIALLFALSLRVQSKSAALL